MKSRRVERLLRFLIVLLGVGIGLAVVLLAEQIYIGAFPGTELRLWWLGVGYAGMGLIGGVVFYLLSDRITRHWSRFTGEVEKHFDKMSMTQMLSTTLGLILGLIVAALISQMLNFMGNGMMTTTLSAILYLLFGAIGFRQGRKRSREFAAMFTGLGAGTGKITRKATAGNNGKLLDTSAIIDGRIMQIARTGFVEGNLVVPLFVADELRHVADSSDPVKRERGRRGLEILNTMEEELSGKLINETADYTDVTDVDVKLLRLARDTNRAVVTCDYNLARSAAVNAVRVLNVNELTNALRPTVTQGQEMTVRIVREGRENSQGIAFMEDGTMIVVDGARQQVGNNVKVTVTSVLQTNAGRMVFAKLKI